MTVTTRIMKLGSAVCEKFDLPQRSLYQGLRAARMARHPGETLRRRRDIATRLSGSAWAGFIDPQAGYRAFGPAELPGQAEALAACREIWAREEANAPDGHDNKPFLRNVMQRDDLERHPALIAFAHSAPVVEAITGYLGSLPYLNAIGLYHSPANDTTRSSQLFHRDADDFTQIKCFVYVHDVGTANGPFTLVPADSSAAIGRRLGHSFKAPRLEDAQIGDAPVVEMAGPAGTGFFVDTSRCLHFGSRARGGDRLAFMFQYTTWPNVSLETDKQGRTGRPILNPPQPSF